jgi:hypothetical protein
VKAVELGGEREEAQMAELMQRFEETALPLLAHRVNDVKGLEWLPEERHFNMWQVGRREGQRPTHSAETVADECEEEKLDTLPGFTGLPAAALLAQEGQASQRRHKRHNKKSWRRR